MSTALYFDATSGVNVVRARGGRTRPDHPAGGVYTLILNPEERRAVRRALDGRPAGAWARTAVRVALGLEPGTPPVGRPSRLPPRQLALRLGAEERRALDAVRLDRTVGGWLRDAIRTAAGFRNTRWTPCAENTLRKHFRRADAAALQRALPGHTPAAIHVRAQRLGLDLVLPDGSLSLRRAAEFAGFTWHQTLQLLRAAGIEPRRLAGPTRDPKKVYRYVTRAELDRALRLRLAAETLYEAAARLGHCPGALRRELHRQGHRNRSGTRVWRLPPGAADAASAALRAPGEPLEAAARRTGISRSALRAWLGAAGLLGPKATHYRRLDPAAVDRVVAAHRHRARRCKRCGASGHYRTTCPRVEIA